MFLLLALYVINKLDISVEKYYAAEIDDVSIAVATKNFGDQITYVGNIFELNIDALKPLTPIDLVIGGSPCNDLSSVNPDRKGLFGITIWFTIACYFFFLFFFLDTDGTGVLFFEFYRIVSILKNLNEQPFFWLFENVSSMHINYKNAISR